ncbi:bicyclomycin resistance protein, putative [Talaromyces stipitatus ATCC 10500]|uniref:Bicyclomycin resistance protein, putative n=1 Tax=Talaromyces stipitatus (strain ATCC 10500 / CBS 375.48 / QM 6759 / NRRL 1006) TaxID=441959 RepID=B8LX36_TALSN|nr:bicyclomycin resistance protein, putative [Talaromyces stipitatus ATCC 10500]EED22686.1 bicyclomycin resistance protein, putative [Talaromyces stipitatus ATCC 10500]
MASTEKLQGSERDQSKIETNNSDDIPATTDTYSESELRPESEKAPSAPYRDAEAANKHDKLRPVPVPRLKRRGLFGQITLIPEVENPRAYARSTKWILTCTISLATLIAPMGTSIFYPALHQVETDLHTSATGTNLSLAFYLLAMAIFPLWWSNWAEAFGRRTIYLISFVLGVVFAILAAISNSIGMLIAVRLLSGGSSASVQAVGVASISDLWEPRERGRAMGIFFLGPQLGPFLAPIIGGALADRWGWRSTMWFAVILAAAMLLMLSIILPETSLRKETTWRTRVNERIGNHDSFLRIILLLRILLIDPFRALLVLRYPAMFLPMFYIGIVTIYFYILNISIQNTFASPPYNFSTLIVGLLYIPSSLGYICGSIFGGRWMDYVMQREARKANRCDETGRPKVYPEERMKENAWAGALLPVVALLWYGWTADKGIYWLCPMIANFFTGFGMIIIISVGITMISEFMPGDPRGLAASVFIRNVLGCVGTVVAAPMLDELGNGWTFTLWALVALASASVIVAITKFGPQWRESMVASGAVQG